MYNNIKNNAVQPIAILGALNLDTVVKHPESLNLIDLDYNYKAGEMPISHETRVQNLGTAVFYEGKLVGELSAIETVCYLILTNKLQHCTISIPNPFKEQDSITLSVSLKNKTKNNVQLVNSTPFISCKVDLELYISSFDADSDLSNLANIEVVEDYTESYIKHQLTNYVYLTAKKLESDITGFGNLAMKQYKTVDEWKASNWEDNYKNSFFTFDINATVKSSLLFFRH